MIVHIGFQKCASTFLQEQIFPNLLGINYKGIIDITDPDIYSRPDITPDNIDTSEKSLYSFEALVGEMGTGIGRYERMVGLKKMGAKKIIIVIRDLKSHIKSVYKEFIYSGGTLTYNDWLKSPHCKFYYFQYHRVIKLYQDNFGYENVLVITQNGLLSNPKDAINKIIKFTGALAIKDFSLTKVNKGLSYPFIKLMRVLNHFTYSYRRSSSFIPKFISSNKVRGVLSIVDKVKDK